MAQSGEGLEGTGHSPTTVVVIDPEEIGAPHDAETDSAAQPPNGKVVIDLSLPENTR